MAFFGTFVPGYGSLKTVGFGSALVGNTRDRLSTLHDLLTVTWGNFGDKRRSATVLTAAAVGGALCSQVPGMVASLTQASTVPAGVDLSLLSGLASNSAEASTVSAGSLPDFVEAAGAALGVASGLCAPLTLGVAGYSKYSAACERLSQRDLFLQMMDGNEDIFIHDSDGRARENLGRLLDKGSITRDEHDLLKSRIIEFDEESHLDLYYADRLLKGSYMDIEGLDTDPDFSPSGSPVQELNFGPSGRLEVPEEETKALLEDARSMENLGDMVSRDRISPILGDEMTLRPAVPLAYSTGGVRLHMNLTSEGGFTPILMHEGLQGDKDVDSLSEASDEEATDSSNGLPHGYDSYEAGSSEEVSDEPGMANGTGFEHRGMRRSNTLSRLQEANKEAGLRVPITPRTRGEAKARKAAKTANAKNVARARRQTLRHGVPGRSLLSPSS